MTWPCPLSAARPLPVCLGAAAAAWSGRSWRVGFLSCVSVVNVGKRNDKSSKTLRTRLHGPGTFEIDVVGEPHHQDGIRAALGSCSPPARRTAVIRSEPSNADDPNALRVEINGHLVGYLGRERAVQVERELQREGCDTFEATCDATVVNGRGVQRGGDASLGVKLDIFKAGQKRKLQASQRESMHEDQQHKAIDALRDWSKWLIGVDFLAGAGCVTVLQLGAQGLPRVAMIAAIVALVAAITCSLLLVRVLAAAVEHVPVRGEAGICGYKMRCCLSVGTLSLSQLVLTCLGAILLVVWVLLKLVPPASEDGGPQEKASVQINREVLRREIELITGETSRRASKHESLVVSGLILVDEHDQVRAQLSADDGAAELVLKDDTGDTYASFYTDSQGGVIKLLGNAGDIVASERPFDFYEGPPFISLEFDNKSQPIIRADAGGTVEFTHEGTVDTGKEPQSGR